jgi:nucleoside-diphosphate-sugar epimerase
MLLTHADLAKSGQALGYSPKIKFEEGIHRFAEWLTRLRVKA